MTIDEAIKQFEERLQIPDYKTKIPEYYEATELAIKVFEEIQQYRELGAVEEIADCIKQSEEEFNMLMEYLHIGTIEEFKALKEKAEPKKPPYDNHNRAGYRCPDCNNTNPWGYNYCKHCGQKLDWSK